MSRRSAKKEGLSTRASRTVIFREIVGCCAIAAFVSLFLMLLLYYGLNHYIREHVEGSERIRAEERQLTTELQMYVSQHNLSISNIKEIGRWETKKHVRIHFADTRESVAYLSGLQRRYDNTILNIQSSKNIHRTYEVRFKDAVVICYVETGKMGMYYSLAFVLSAICAIFFFVYVMLLLMRKRIYYLIRLRDELEHLKAGDLEQEVTVQGKDELSQIADGMNSMRRNVLGKIQAEKEAITANHELITAMSHDLRTPLTRQIGYLEILHLKKYREEAELNEYIEKARNNAFIMKDTTDKLFRYFLAFGDQQMAQKQTEVDGKALLNTVLKEQIAYIVSQNYVVSFEEINEQFRMMIDPEEFARIFDNIFHNMKKYADKDVPIYITHITQKEEFILMIQNGVREDTSLVESTKVGLKIVERIMKSMGGTMEVVNDGQFFVTQLIFSVTYET